MPDLPPGATYLPIPQVLPTGGSGNIRDANRGGFWFSPLQPLTPIAPDDQRVRRWPYQLGENVWQPKVGEGSHFWALREFADTCDLFRLVLETVKDRLCSRKWELRLVSQPGENKKNLQARQEKDPRIKKLTQFFKKPDGINSFSKWVRPLIEDMLVIDAGCIYKERDRKGKIANAIIIDGATIKRLITDQGLTPPPPSPAYQQWLYGLAAFNMTTDDLKYVMHNPRTYRLYGFGCVEQNMNYIATALLRQEFIRKEYTEGNIPEAFCFLPSDLPKDRVMEVQDWFDSMMVGDLSRRRRLTFLPGYGKSSDSSKPNVLFTKDQLLKDPLDDWLFQMFCYNLGTTPGAMMKMMNRATAQQNAETAEEEGLVPRESEIEEVMTDLCAEMGYADIEWRYQSRQETDALKNSQVAVALVNAGIKTRNQVREELGDDEDDSPMADELCVTTATGVIPIDTDARTEQMTSIQDAMPQEDDNSGPPSKKPGAKKPQKNPKKKVLKRLGARIEPGRLTRNSTEARNSVREHFHKVFRRQKDGAKESASGLVKAASYLQSTSSLSKNTEKTPGEIADAIYAAIEAEFLSIPHQVRPQLEDAVLSGIAEGIVQVEITDSGVIAVANEVAQEFARDRAAEMIGKRYNADGELVDNPNAEWVISDTTRDRIKQIVIDSFKEETRIGDVSDRIQQALADEGEGNGIFSEARAEMIADTEIMRAQVEGNLDVWKNSGVVETVEWFTSEDEGVCPECEGNDREVVKLGALFSSGDDAPPAHPNCRCVLSVKTVKDTD